MSIDYKSMKVGERVRMPGPAAWEGENKNLYYEVQEYCESLNPSPQFEVRTFRPTREIVEFWLVRIR